jgi:hypothetical protein
MSRPYRLSLIQRGSRLNRRFSALPTAALRIHGGFSVLPPGLASVRVLLYGRQSHGERFGPPTAYERVRIAQRGCEALEAVSYASPYNHTRPRVILHEVPGHEPGFSQVGQAGSVTGTRTMPKVL